jgi:hypothetical protein
MANVLFNIILRQFWYKRFFFGMQALSKIRGLYVDDQNWHGYADRLDLCAQTGQTDLGDFVKM